MEATEPNSSLVESHNTCIHMTEYGKLIGYSSYSRSPGLLISKHLSSDPHNSIEEPQILKRGTSNELSDRYGDYFAACLDPSDRSDIWIAGEYHEQPTWSTYISRLHI